MNRKIIYNFLMLFTLLSGSIMYAQTVSGTVTDATGPLPQATVNVKGTDNSTVTDIDGRYTLNNVESNAVLVFSFMGFQSREVAVNGQTDISITLQEDAQQLSEVVITGYVSQSKKSITGAVSQVNLNNLEKTRIPDVAQALQGQVAGVFVAANTGAPGDGSVIRIRGEGTVGDNRVLYVVDGTPTRDIMFLNQADVETMTVLKDASATAIYGSRAAGGVIIITTKQGAKDRSSFDVDFFTGIHYVQNLPDMLNTDQYLNIMDQSWRNTAGNDPTAESPYAFDRRTRTDLADTDWLDELFTQGISRNLQVTASGGNDKTSYLISGGYYGMNGVVTEDNDQYKRVNFRTNVNSKLNEMFTVGTNMQLSFQSQDKLSSSGDAPGVIRHALIRPPVLGVFKDPSDPTYSNRDPYTDLPFYTGPVRDVGYLSRYEFSSNPLAIVHFTDDVRETFLAFGNVFAEGAFLDKALKFRTNLGMDLRFSHNKAFYENYGDNNIESASDPFFGMGRNNRPNSLSESRAQDVTFTWSNTINYVKTFGDVHDVNFLVGHELIKNKWSNIVGARSGFDNDSDNFRYLGNGGFSTSGPYSPPSNDGTASDWTLLSFFASGNYGYDNRYHLTATIRADASSRFGPDNKWGYFPSFGANWIVTNEKFMENVNWLSNLRLRGSWGQSGNQEIPNGAYNTYVDTSSPLGPQIIRFGIPNIKWETTTQSNFGIDLGFLSNKLNISADYFHKKTDDIVLTVAPPGTTGGSLIQASYINSGEVVNKGFEFAVNFQNNDNEFKYGVNANLATLNNEVTKLQRNVALIETAGGRARTVVGQPLNAYYGYQFEGIYQNQAEIDAQLYNGANGRVPGDIRFKDINGDGQINADDRTFIGNPVPKITYGLSFNASYKNFDISFLFQGVEDVDRYNDQKQILDYDSRPFNSTTAALGAWTGEGTSNTVPRLTFNDTGGSQISSIFVEDASYLRLKNIEIGYTFNKSLPFIDYLRIYASGQNLLTWTDYTGLDPESTDLVDRGTYPQTAAVMFGAKIKL
ncbi:MAG: SusC/RagA family TonB-linked outer membrane protein [Flavobacterium sp.]